MLQPLGQIIEPCQELRLTKPITGIRISSSAANVVEGIEYKMEEKMIQFGNFGSNITEWLFDDNSGLLGYYGN